MEYVFSSRNIKNMLIPLVIRQALIMMVGTADTVIISYTGETTILGVALVDIISYPVIVVLAAVSTGGAVTISQYPGKKAEENANESANQLVTVSLLFSLVLMMFCVLFHTLILSLLFEKVIPDVMAAANMYSVATALSYPLLGLYNPSATLYHSIKRTKVTMHVPLLTDVSNIAGNIIDIFMLHVGVSGMAVPILISRSTAAVITVGLAFQSSNEIFIYWRHPLAWNRKLIEKILGIAVPNGTENRPFALDKVLATSIIAMSGTTQITANGIANSVGQVVVLVVNATDLATIPLVD